MASWAEGKFDDGESLLAALKTQHVGSLIHQDSVKVGSRKRVRDFELFGNLVLWPA
jgi:hypothetical protein